MTLQRVPPKGGSTELCPPTSRIESPPSFRPAPTPPLYIPRIHWLLPLSTRQIFGDYLVMRHSAPECATVRPKPTGRRVGGGVADVGMVNLNLRPSGDSGRQIFGKSLVIVPRNALNCWGFHTIAALATKRDKPLRARLSGAFKWLRG